VPLIYLPVFLLTHLAWTFHNTSFLKFKVCKSVHHHAIQINQPTRCNNFSSLLLDVYIHLNMFRASSHPSSGAQQLQYQPLVLPLERGGSSVVGRGRAGPGRAGPGRASRPGTRWNCVPSRAHSHVVN
jgi:hypothetical protein